MMTHLLKTAVLTMTIFVSLSLYAQMPQQQPLGVQKIVESLYQVTGGSGANTGFFVGASEVIVIDAKMSEESAQGMIAEIAKLTQLPIRRIILTHSDRDHVDGLKGFPHDLNIISHENTRRDMDKAFTDETMRAYLPDITFPDRVTLYSGGERIELYYFGPAHTSGDIVIYFPAEKTVFLGDLVFTGRDPLIHLSKNGSSFGLVKVLKAILQLDADTFARGHGDIIGRGELEAEIKYVEEKQAQVKALVDEGKSLEDVKKALGVQEGGRWMSLPEVVYRELTEVK